MFVTPGGRTYHRGYNITSAVARNVAGAVAIHNSGTAGEVTITQSIVGTSGLDGNVNISPSGTSQATLVLYLGQGQTHELPTSALTATFTGPTIQVLF